MRKQKILIQFETIEIEAQGKKDNRKPGTYKGYLTILKKQIQTTSVRKRVLNLCHRHDLVS